ncbi:MAG: hypothetical protein FRX48_04988 [Lasallia pustulata]|uniref:Uncharacterized protein n=1 Tax=Lasallia pustulata TaxID=136370 RepID=A0A5M8PRU4_9LECA|nr:MAG: hypothetical protein FRX48_04988 [Lasallia pustulata]
MADTNVHASQVSAMSLLGNIVVLLNTVVVAHQIFHASGKEHPRGSLSVSPWIGLKLCVHVIAQDFKLGRYVLDGGTRSPPHIRLPWHSDERQLIVCGTANAII